MQAKVYFLILCYWHGAGLQYLLLWQQMPHTCVFLQTRASVLKATSTVASSLRVSVAGNVTRMSCTQPKSGKGALPLRAVSIFSAFSGVSAICRAVL